MINNFCSLKLVINKKNSYNVRTMVSTTTNYKNSFVQKFLLKKIIICESNFTCFSFFYLFNLYDKTCQS